MSTLTPDQRAGRIAKTLLANQQRLQMDLGDRLDMDSGTISKALNGKRKWTLAEIEAMAEFFDVSVSLFFEDPADVVRSRCSSTEAFTLPGQLSLRVAA